MASQENTFDFSKGFAGADTNPPLFEVTSQLSSDQEVVPQPTTPPAKPQVVFVEQRRETQIVEIHIDSNNTQPTASEPAAAEPVPEPALEPAVQAPVESIAAPVPLARPLSKRPPESAAVQFAFDPFVCETDGVIPVMPTLPIIKAKKITHIGTRQRTAKASFRSRSDRFLNMLISLGRTARFGKLPANLKLAIERYD